MNIKQLFAPLFFVCFFLESRALSTPVVIGIRAGKDLSENFSKKLGIPLVGTDAKEFENGNTYVRLLKSVEGDEVLVPLPETLDANSLMEALILVRTAKTNGARSVTLRTNVPLTQVKVIDKAGNKIFLDLNSLFATSGLDFIDQDTRGPKALTPIKNNGNQEPPKTAVVHSINHPKLAANLAERLSLSTVQDISQIQPGAEAILVWTSVDSVNEGFLRLLSTATDLSLRKISSQVVLGYLPYARSDKVDIEGVTVSGRLAADLIESSGISRATFVRAHAPQSQGFFRIPTTNLTSRPTVIQKLSTMDVDALVAPDSGAAKSVYEFAKTWGKEIPVGVANKERDPITAKSRFLGLGGLDPRGKNIAVIDDETATGSTLAEVAEYLKSQGAKRVYAVVTHLAGSAKKALLSGAIDQVIVTDTVIPPAEASERLVVLSVAEEVANSLQKSLRARNIASQSKCPDLSTLLSRLRRDEITSGD